MPYAVWVGGTRALNYCKEHLLPTWVVGSGRCSGRQSAARSRRPGLQTGPCRCCPGCGDSRWAGERGALSQSAHCSREAARAQKQA